MLYAWHLGLGKGTECEKHFEKQKMEPRPARITARYLVRAPLGFRVVNKAVFHADYDPPRTLNLVTVIARSPRNHQNLPDPVFLCDCCKSCLLSPVMLETCILAERWQVTVQPPIRLVGNGCEFVQTSNNIMTPFPHIARALGTQSLCTNRRPSITNHPTLVTHLYLVRGQDFGLKLSHISFIHSFVSSVST